MSEKKSMKEVLEAENMIKTLAMWAVSKGNTVVPRSQKEAVKLNTRVIQRWAEYKRLILTGEFTYDELEADLIDRYGCTLPATPKPDKTIGF